MMVPLGVVALIVGAGGCSDAKKSTAAPTDSTAPVASSTLAASATPGDAFCALAETARTAGSAVDTSEGDPATLKAEVDVALAASKAAVAAAPSDFVEIGKATVVQQEAVVALLETYGYSFTKAVTSDEGKAFFSDPNYAKVKSDRDTYLQAHCDLQPTTNSSSGAGVTLSPGDDGIRELFQLLQIGGEVQISDDQIECLVGELSGKITAGDLQSIGSGQAVTDAGTSLFVAAIGTCGVVLG